MNVDNHKKENKFYLKSIYVVSVIIPIVVACLILLPSKLPLAGDYIKILPSFHALINSLTALTLLVAFVAIKMDKIGLHKKLMLVSFVLGVFFLLSYVIYHASVESVKFGDINHDGIISPMEFELAGNNRTIYLTILASHVLLSILVVPFVLYAFYYALTDQISKHKRIVKFTFPIWMYVSVTGVVVYMMIKPYYL